MIATGFASGMIMNSAHAATLLLAVALGLSGSACAQDTGSAAGNEPAADATLAIQFPTQLTINLQPPSEARQTEDVTLTLTNTTKSDVTLEASNDCASHTWYITDANEQLVDGETMCPMIYEPVTLTIKAGQSFSATRQVTLTKAKYADGAKYKLNFSFWTIGGAAAFTAQVVH